MCGRGGKNENLVDDGQQGGGDDVNGADDGVEHAHHVSKVGNVAGVMPRVVAGLGVAPAEAILERRAAARIRIQATVDDLTDIELVVIRHSVTVVGDARMRGI